MILTPPGARSIADRSGLRPFAGILFRRFGRRGSSLASACCHCASSSRALKGLIGFDVPAIQKIYPWFRPKAKLHDTLMYSRIIWTDLKDADFARRKRGKVAEVTRSRHLAVGAGLVELALRSRKVAVLCDLVGHGAALHSRERGARPLFRARAKT